MQDNVPRHAARRMQEELQERGIYVIFWPPFSPDLNPIEAVWDIMKDWIQENYGDQEKLSYDTLRQAVKEAWDAVTPEHLDELINSIPYRYQAVIDADGRYTKY